MFVTSFAFCVITFEPIEVQTCSAPQNDRLNLVFVKDIKVVVKKMTRNRCNLIRKFEKYMALSVPIKEGNLEEGILEVKTECCYDDFYSFF